MIKNKGSRGKKLLTVIVLFLGIVLICLALGIILSIPSRTREIFGPAAPDLPLSKTYTQSIILLSSGDALFQPIQTASADILFTIEQGDSLDTMIGKLSQLGLIKHNQAFRAYLIYSGIDTRIQPGDYQFSSSISEVELANQFSTPNASQANLIVLAGWRVEEIGEALNQAGIELAKEQLIDLVHTNKKEGYLFPGSYLVSRDIQAQDLMDILYDDFVSNITSDLETQIINQGLSLHQAVILASIIEREAILEAEMPQIASVFLNRFKADMNLAADPTVQYALGYNTSQETWWTNPLSADDLEILSPYNTYKNAGLPPGPICNPSFSALQAVAMPANTDFYFFRAACDGSGSHQFAETYQEHLQNACP
jgi:UPF0755 protein